MADAESFLRDIIDSTMSGSMTSMSDQNFWKRLGESPFSLEDFGHGGKVLPASNWYKDQERTTLEEMRMESNRIVLVDAMNLAYQVYHSTHFLETSTGENTGLRFGFLRALNSYGKKLKPRNIVVCWDPTGPDSGPSAIPEREASKFYKTNRSPNERAMKMFAEIPGLRQILSYTGFTQAYAKGYEADDVIATLARSLGNQGHEVLVVSTDDDLCQLLSYPSVMKWRSGKSKTDQFTDRDYVEGKYKVRSEDLLIYRAAAGDTSDNLRRAFGPTSVRLIQARLARKVDIPLGRARKKEEDLELWQRPP